MQEASSWVTYINSMRLVQQVYIYECENIAISVKLNSKQLYKEKYHRLRTELDITFPLSTKRINLLLVFVLLLATRRVLLWRYTRTSRRTVYLAIQ